MAVYNFASAAPDEEIVFGACRPEHDQHAPTDDSVTQWISFIEEQGIERVVCLLSANQLASYEDLLGTYRQSFDPENVCHAPIEDFDIIGKSLLHDRVLPFLQESKRAGTPVVVHCSAGSGRTGHVLALWLMADRGYDAEQAVDIVKHRTRDPLEATTRAELTELLT